MSDNVPGAIAPHATPRRLEPEIIYFVLVISGVVGGISVLFGFYLLFRYTFDCIAHRRANRRVGYIESGNSLYRRPSAATPKHALSRTSATLAALDLENITVGLESQPSSLSFISESRQKPRERPPGDHASESRFKKNKTNLLDAANTNILENIAENACRHYFVYALGPEEDEEEEAEYYDYPPPDQGGVTIPQIVIIEPDEPSRFQTELPVEEEIPVVVEPVRNANGLETLPGPSKPRRTSKSMQTDHKNLAIRSGLISSVLGPLHRFITSLFWSGPVTVQGSENEPSTVAEDIKRLTSPKSVGLMTMLNFMQGEGNAHGILEEDRPDEPFIAPDSRPRTAPPPPPTVVVLEEEEVEDDIDPNFLNIKARDSIPKFEISPASSQHSIPDMGHFYGSDPALKSSTSPGRKSHGHAKVPGKHYRAEQEKCCCCC